jgi:hypothetical protein
MIEYLPDAMGFTVAYIIYDETPSERLCVGEIGSHDGRAPTMEERIVTTFEGSGPDIQLAAILRKAKRHL